MRSNSEFEVNVTNIYVPLIIIFALGLVYSNWNWDSIPDSTFLLSSCPVYLPKWQQSRDHFNFLPQNSYWCGNLTSHKDMSSSPNIGLRSTVSWLVVSSHIPHCPVICASTLTATKRISDGTRVSLPLPDL